MATEASQVAGGLPTTNAPLRKRKPKRSSKAKKKRAKPTPQYQRHKPKARETKKTRRLLRKRVREYNSDDSDDEMEEEKGEDDEAIGKGSGFGDEGSDSGHDDVVEEEDGGKGDTSEDEGKEEEEEEAEEGEGMEHGVAKLAEGCRAFKLAFSKIMQSKTAETDPLGPVLSAHKKLVAEKLAEEMEDQKAKGEARKERRAAGEKGHVLPLNYLDSKEKFLISVATKGVVKLFNAVNKALNPQRNLDSSKMKDAKGLAKRSKEAFLSELRKPSIVNKAGDGTNMEEPGWAPLRDDYMLTSSKLKDWDKMGDPAFTNAPQKTPLESSSDEE